MSPVSARRGVPFSVYAALFTLVGLSVAAQLVKGRQILGRGPTPRR